MPVSQEIINNQLSALGKPILTWVSQELNSLRDVINADERIEALLSAMVENKFHLCVLTSARLILLYKSSIIMKLEKTDFPISEIQNTSIENVFLGAILTINSKETKIKLSGITVADAKKFQAAITRIILQNETINKKEMETDSSTQSVQAPVDYKNETISPNFSAAPGENESMENETNEDSKDSLSDENEYGSSKRTIFKPLCNCCGSSKVEIQYSVTTSVDDQPSLSGGILGGIVGGAAGAVGGALLEGTRNVKRNLDVKYVCDECGHSDDSCTIENPDGERLSNEEFGRYMYYADPDEEIYVLQYIKHS